MKTNMDYETLRNSMTVQDAVRVLRDTNCYSTMDIAKNVILKALDEHMSHSEEPNKWIPVSERKPKKGQTVLTFDTYYNKFGINTLSSDGLTWRKYTNHVTAWMPLPEPYKAESEDNKE